MRSDELTYEQVQKIRASLARLRRRMERTGFPPDDAVRRAAEEAHDAIHELMVRLHYLGCDRLRDRGDQRPGWR
jgi:hypothetical protein